MIRFSIKEIIKKILNKRVINLILLKKITNKKDQEVRIKNLKRNIKKVIDKRPHHPNQILLDLDLEVKKKKDSNRNF
jgi:hypothetical protein